MAILTGRDDIQLTCLLVGEDDEHGILELLLPWSEGGGNRRLWRRLARAPGALGGRPVGRSLPWECRAAQSFQARPEEAREPTSGTAKGVALAMLPLTLALALALTLTLALTLALTLTQHFGHAAPDPSPNPNPNPALWPCCGTSSSIVISSCLEMPIRSWWG
eukprot:scaffold6564_cov30-Phaeocystis_antarctica.AAC.2